MQRHPTVQVPNIGPMDHAWDLLGEWQAEFELPETEDPVHGKVMFRSWTDAELQLDPVEAAIAGHSFERAARAGERGAPDGCRRWRAPVGAARAVHQLVSAGDDVAGLAPSLRARRGRRGGAALPRAGDSEPGVLSQEVSVGVEGGRGWRNGRWRCRSRASALLPARRRSRSRFWTAGTAPSGRCSRWVLLRRRAGRPPHPHRAFRLRADGVAGGCRAGSHPAAAGPDLPHRAGSLPFCGTEQSFEVMGRFSLPKTLHCGNCGRELAAHELKAGEERA